MILLGSKGRSVASDVRRVATKLTAYLLVFLIVFGPNIALALTNSQVDLGKTSFTTAFWDSGKTTLSPTSTAPGARIPDISYAGSALSEATTYYWRLKLWDNNDVSGSWSAGTDSFALLAQPADSIQNINYTYDKVGNITELADYSQSGAGKTVVLAYDDLNRLTSASTTAASTTPYSQTYTYSAMGNITNKSDQGSYSYAETSYTNPQATSFRYF